MLTIKIFKTNLQYDIKSDEIVPQGFSVPCGYVAVPSETTQNEYFDAIRNFGFMHVRRNKYVLETIVPDKLFYVTAKKTGAKILKLSVCGCGVRSCKCGEN